MLQVACSRDGLVLDAFAGSGTTGHAVLAQNASDGGQRRFILAEMDAGIAQDITAERIRRVIEGYDYRDQRGGAHHEPGIGGGFRYCTLGETLFDQAGAIREHVTYEELARHVYFVETGAPLPAEGILDAPLLGIHNGTAVYLVTSGVLTYRRLSELPAHHGPATIYAPGCNINEQRLAEIGTTFKQIPYEIRVG